MLHAGLFDDSPRTREIVWIMLAQRAARGLASLYAHANLFDLKQAKAFQVEWTPRGWMRPDLDLLGFEQQLYLRQPGYGSSYVTGKYLLEDLMRVRAHELGANFSLRGYFDEVNGAGMIPVSMIRWQLTGNDDEARALLSGTRRSRPRNEEADLPARALPRLCGECRHDRRLQRHLRRQEGRRAEDGDRRRRAPARQLFVPGQRPRAGHRGRDLARAGRHVQELSPARQDDLRRRARRALLDVPRPGQLAAAFGARHARAGRAGDLPADLRQSRSQRHRRARHAESRGRPPRRLAGRRTAERETQGNAHRSRRAGARGRALRDLRHGPAAGFRLARCRRRHAPLRQYQCGRQPSRRSPASRAARPTLESLQKEAETAYLRDIAKKHTQPLASPVLIRNVRVFDTKTTTLGEPADVYVHNGRIAAIYPAGSHGAGGGNRHRGRRTRAAAGPVRHALARRRVELDPPDRRRRHDLARHGHARQCLPRRAHRRHRARRRDRSAHRARRLHRGREPLLVPRQLRRQERRRGAGGDRLVCAARLPPGQALQLHQARVGRADRRLCPLPRSARERPRAGVLAFRARGPRRLRRAPAHQPADAQFRLRPGHRLAHARALQPGRRAGAHARPRFEGGARFHRAPRGARHRHRRDDGDVRGHVHPGSRATSIRRSRRSPITCRSPRSAPGTAIRTT